MYLQQDHEFRIYFIIINFKPLHVYCCLQQAKPGGCSVWCGAGGGQVGRTILAQHTFCLTKAVQITGERSVEFVTY